MLYEGLWRQFGETAMPFYGYCGLDSAHSSRFERRAEFPVEMVKNFSRGSTIFMPLGRPLQGHHMAKPRLTSQRDLESLRNIARNYADYDGGAILMDAPNNDNKGAFQYIRILETGRIHHADTVDLARGTHTVSAALKDNCRFLFGSLARLPPSDPKVNCTRAYSRELVAAGVDVTTAGEDEPVAPDDYLTHNEGARLYDINCTDSGQCSGNKRIIGL